MSAALDLPMPFNEETERACFGPVLTAAQPERSLALWSSVMEQIRTPHAFFVRDHRLIAAVMCAEMAESRSVDGLAVYESLKRYSFQEVLELLRRLQDDPSEKRRPKPDPDINAADSVYMAVGERFRGLAACGLASALERSAKTVAELHRRRQVIQLLSEGAAKLAGPIKPEELEAVSDRVTNRINVVLGGGSRSGHQTLAEAFDQALVQHDEARARGEFRKASYGLRQLDELAPMRAGEMVVLAGEPGSGKTSLALMIAESTSRLHGVTGTVGIVSREMTNTDLAKILMMRSTRVPKKNIDRGWLTPEQRDQVTKMAERWRKDDYLTIQDGSRKCTVDNVCAWARQRHLQTMGRFSLLVIDHLLLLAPVDPRHKEYDKVSDATWKLKSLARDLEITVLVLSQLSRNKPAHGRKAHEPSMRDLKGSGSIEADADTVIVLHVSSDDGPVRVVKAIVDKNRSGPRGRVELVFHAAGGQTFEEAPKDHTPKAGDHPHSDPPEAKRKPNTKMFEKPESKEDALADPHPDDEPRPF